MADTAPTLDRLLSVLASAPAGRTTTASALAAAAGTALTTARCNLKRLMDQGLVEQPEPGRWRATREGRRLHRSGARPSGNDRKRVTFRSRLWSALRRLRKATVPDLVALAASPDAKHPENNARDYLNALARAGYVRRMAHRVMGPGNGAGHLQFVLVRDSGPKAPFCTRAGTVIDPNTGESHAIK